MKSFSELIFNAQEALDAIASHEEFAKLLEKELWDDPEITLGDARQALDDLEKIYNSSKEAT